MGIEPFLVSSVMMVSIAQRLVRRICEYCKKSYQPPWEALEFWDLAKHKDAVFVHGSGCFNCMDKGYRGRIGVYEVLPINEMVQDMILNRSSAQEISRIAQKENILTTLKEDAAAKVLDGTTTLEEAASAIMV
jgi:type IV pilus assembly protein PilB